ncbi:MAG: hypothetical protein IIV81_01695, partial [Clostridia bacterium]|nr:hypothetical protein [Clostridia bacterium]
KQKFLSRKFWAGLAGFIAPILILFKMPENDVTTVTALLTSCGSLIAYIFAETSVDMARESTQASDDIY